MNDSNIIDQTQLTIQSLLLVLTNYDIQSTVHVIDKHQILREIKTILDENVNPDKTIQCFISLFESYDKVLFQVQPFREFLFQFRELIISYFRSNDISFSIQGGLHLDDFHSIFNEHQNNLLAFFLSSDEYHFEAWIRENFFVLEGGIA